MLCRWVPSRSRRMLFTESRPINSLCQLVPGQGERSSVNRLERMPFTMANKSGCFAGEFLPDQGTGSSVNRLERKPFTTANKSGCFAGECLPDQGTGSSVNPDRLTVFVDWCQIKADALQWTDWSGCRSPWPINQDGLPVSCFQIKADALHRIQTA